MPPFVDVSLWLVEKVARVVFLANHKENLCGRRKPRENACEQGFEFFGARWSKSCALIGCPSCPARGLPRWSKKKRFSFWPCNKSLIDQAWSVKIASYWPGSLVRFYRLTSISSRSVKRQKRNLANVHPFDLTIGRSHKLSTSVWSAKRS